MSHPGLPPATTPLAVQLVLTAPPAPYPHPLAPRNIASGARSLRNMTAIEEVMRSAADSALNLLLMGETGTGKDVMARRIHQMSTRRERPFLKVDCAALNAGLLESELFGHQRGAFTGATTAKPGLLECAPGGTIFLDEVGELPAQLQAKLLNVIEAKQVVPIGGVRARPIDVRFIAATNRALADEASRGTFRRDLYFRLAGLAVTLPPLRERRQELPALAAQLIAEACARQGRAAPTLSPEVLARLEGHPWPGNIRELKNVLERAILMCPDDRLESRHIWFDDFHEAPANQQTALPMAGQPVSERQRISEALERCGGNQTRAARLLGVARSTLTLRLAAYDLPRPRKAKPASSGTEG